MIGYILGLLVVAWISALEWVYPLIAATFLVLLVFGWRRSPQLVGLLGALLFATFWGQYQLGHRLPDSVAKVDLQLDGEISSIVQRLDGNQRFEFQLLTPSSDYPQLRRLTLTLYAPEPPLREGDRLLLNARIQSPKAYLNPDSPDSRRRALQNRIDAKGYVRDLIAHDSNPSLRQRTYDLLHERFDPQTRGFIAALVLGESGGLSDDQWELLSLTGTVHLVVVSGLHLGVLAFGGLWCGRAVLGALSISAVSGSSRLYMLPGLLAICMTSLYLWFGGAGIALQRAWVLISVLLLGQLMRRTPNLNARFKLALILVTLLDPLVVLQLGFWLSFGLVWILMQIGRLRGRTNRFVTAVRVQWVLSLMLLPVLLYSLAQLNLLSMLSNLWAIPWVSLGVLLLPLLLPLALYGPVAEALLRAWVDLFWWGLAVNQSVGLSPAWIPPNGLALLLAVVGVTLVLLPLRLRWLGCVLLLPAFTYQPTQSEAFKVALLDVGQGQSAIIDFPGERWIYDTGPAYGETFAVARQTLIPTLKRRPDLPISGLIISHSDRDHAGGLDALLEYQRPDSVLSGQPHKVPGRACSEGYEKRVGASYLRVGGLIDVTNDNDASCWIYITNGHCSLLMAGDMSVAAESRLMREFESHSLTWLHLSHHGSKTSTADRWLEFWRPQIALNSSGRNNPFGHPHADIKQRLVERAIPLLDTAELGAIYLRATSTQCTTKSFLETKRRYWH